MVITTSAPRHASGTEFARVPPPATSGSEAYSLRSNPQTVCPALTRFCAIGRPMLPRPIKPIVAITVSRPLLTGVALLRLFARSHHDQPHICAEQAELEHARQYVPPKVRGKKHPHRGQENDAREPPHAPPGGGEPQAHSRHRINDCKEHRS